MKKALLLTTVLLISNLLIAQAEFWGITSNGGTYNIGVIFKTDSTGSNQSIEYNFHIINNAKNPNGALAYVNNGKLYGLAKLGGLNNKGVLFEYDPINDSLIIKVNFDGTNGNEPYGSLIQASNGKVYGMTSKGGIHNAGVLFEYNTVNDTFIKKIDFNVTNNGANPKGSLIQASNGKLYGMTHSGGVNNKGVLFEYDINNDTLITKIYLGQNNLGAHPQGDLFLASNGRLYGMTTDGGINNTGILFEYNITNNDFTTKIEFIGSNGTTPYGSLIQASNGKLYGTTTSGGSNNNGVLFEYNIISDIILIKANFNNNTSGRFPHSSLLKGYNGKLYGTTYSGGIYGAGVIFEYDINNDTLIKKIDFNDDINGSLPQGKLTQTNNGQIYGMTVSGGKGKLGIIYNFNPYNNTLVTKQDLCVTPNGANPQKDLIMATNGKLYGVTNIGGLYNKGVLFEYNPINHMINKIIDFDGANLGAIPVNKLIQANNGNLYGMTNSGGVYNAGTIFEYRIYDNTVVKKADFDYDTFGHGTYSALTQVNNGILYGITISGGIINGGTIFEFNININTILKKADFELTNGMFPTSSLLKTLDGRLFGTAIIGGANGNGVLFEYDLTNNIIINRIDFNGTNNGSEPLGSLIQSSSGELYGMTSEGGVNNKGVLFEYDIINNTLIKKVDFNGTNNGANPRGSLMQSSSGKLYGMTSIGGLNNKGVLFEYDIVNDTLIKKLDFNGANGAIPLGRIIEPGTSTSIFVNTKSKYSYISLFPNPNNGKFTLEIKPNNNKLQAYTVEVYNAMGTLIHSELLEVNNNLSKHMDFEHLSKGVYFIRLRSKDGVLNARFIIH